LINFDDIKMLLKKTLRYLLYTVFSSLCVYLIIIYSFGGFGKKAPTFTTVKKPNAALLFGHRGIADYCPENSREGLKEAVRVGFRAIEADIRKTKDNQFVVFNDDDAMRMLGIDVEVRNATVSELKKKEIILRNCTRSDAKVPTLDEFMASDEDSTFIYLDMKSSTFEDADEIVELIRNYGREKSVILTNWDPLFIFYVEANYPEIMTALEGFDSGKEWLYELMPTDLKPDFLSGFFYKTDEDHLNWLKKNDLMDRKIIYGVDSLNYNEALDAGFMNIIIDYDTNMCKDPRIIDLLNS
jgi:hypothetical protein